ncbi:MAG TPA: bifunctional phosphoribosylaminoimidazolecarboxamide formyltransferase/IMP cyclohydrolase [Acidimicrobiia bacterium]|nr:bifunctional phosphoribosylaminoimidazolecarboxamide formyltransferase/IMP cyclohydrolase [Acidimicrobiia bacterium]
MRALLSVWDKSGLVDFARGLHELGWELVSSGGTARALDEAGIRVTPLADVTGFPEMLDHRVVTLHPKVHGGILADRSNEAHRADLEQHGIAPFDMVVSNLYPFVESPDIETIDIGGPAMTRAAAKNHAWVAIVTSPDQYDSVLAELREQGVLSDAAKRALALEAFARTAAYDAAIVAWLQRDEVLPEHLVLALDRTSDELRYGENPHQQAARYRAVGTRSWWDAVLQHSGVALSYLNFYDTDAAWQLVHDLGSDPAVAIIKHANPCGVAVAADLATAYQRALECDERSAFGGIVALNRSVDQVTVERMVQGPQADVVIAPGYEEGVVSALRKKRKNTRLLEAPPPQPTGLDVRQISGGFLVQTAHEFVSRRDDWRVVTKRAPTEEEWRDAELAWRVCGHVKSNAIVLVKDGQAVGIGAGQQNRVQSGEIAAEKAAGRAAGGACASDAFYPFPDGVEAAASAGVAVVVQPGGSVGDERVIEKADELGLAMVFTGERHFLH